jgi:hypothetical protein
VPGPAGRWHSGAVGGCAPGFEVAERAAVRQRRDSGHLRPNRASTAVSSGSRRRRYARCYRCRAAGVPSTQVAEWAGHSVAVSAMRRRLRQGFQRRRRPGQVNGGAPAVPGWGSNPHWGPFKGYRGVVGHVSVSCEDSCSRSALSANFARIRREGADGPMSINLRLAEALLTSSRFGSVVLAASVVPCCQLVSAPGGSWRHSGSTTRAVAASLARHSQTCRDDANTRAIVRVATVREQLFALGPRSNICEADRRARCASACRTPLRWLRSPAASTSHERPRTLSTVFRRGTQRCLHVV